MSDMEDFKDEFEKFNQFRAAFEEATTSEFDSAEFASDVNMFAWKTKVVYDSFIKQGFTQTEAKDFIVAMLKNGDYTIL